MEDQPPNQAAPAIELADVMKTAAQDPIWFLRGHAIQAYSNLEQSLCSLFAQLSGTSRDVAAILFFSMRSAHTVRVVIGRLLEKAHPKTHSEFWRSYAKILSQLTESRNDIVHWTAVTEVDQGGFKRQVLAPSTFPYIADSTALAKAIDAQALSAFIEKCSFASRLCNMFHMYLMKQCPVDPMWNSVFSRDVQYPPEPGHPLGNASR